MTKQNLFQAIPAELPEELCEILTSSEQVRIERIVSRGHCSPDGFWYDQDQREFVLLVQGEAVLEFQDPTESVRLVQGDWLSIAAHRKHRVASTSERQDTLWLAVFY